MLPEVPRNIDIDGKLRSSEHILTDYICNFTSTLLVVPVSNLWPLLCIWCKGKGGQLQQVEDHKCVSYQAKEESHFKRLRIISIYYNKNAFQ